MASPRKKAKSNTAKVGGNFSISKIQGTTVTPVAKKDTPKKRNCSPDRCPQYTKLSASDAALVKQLHAIRANAPKKMVNGKRKFEDTVLARQMSDALSKLHLLNKKAGDVIKTTGKTVGKNQVNEARYDIQAVVDRFKKYA